jgi:hypothetical protein
LNHQKVEQNDRQTEERRFFSQPHTERTSKDSKAA